MDNRTNTIAGWVLAGGIVALGLGIASSMYFDGERPEKMGYPIEGVESSEGGAVAAVPIATLLATADAAKGEAVFKKCAACHTINAGGAAGIGPNLHGIMGKGIAGGSFAYSDALKGKGGTWTWEAMNEWLTNPRKFADGTKMTFAGLGNAEDRANLLVYMNAQGSALALPAAPAPEAAAPAEGEAAPAADGAAAAAPAADAAAAPAAAGAAPAAPAAPAAGATPAAK